MRYMSNVLRPMNCIAFPHLLLLESCRSSFLKIEKSTTMPEMLHIVCNAIIAYFVANIPENTFEAIKIVRDEKSIDLFA